MMKCKKVLVLTLAAGALAACQTNPVLISNPYKVVESRGNQQLRLRFARVVPSHETLTAVLPPGTSSVRYKLVADAGANGQVYRFQLPFTAVNDGGSTWTLDGAQFELTWTSGTQTFTRVPQPLVATTIPPGGNSKFYVLFEIEAPNTVPRDDLIRSSYKLTVKDAGGLVLLEREFSGTEVNQGTQMWRLAGSVVGIILLVGIL